MEGDWHFLGACEPEPILDRGWFNSAASRAMVVCSRTFFDFIGEGLQKEALVQRQGMCLMYNETSRYAETARLTVSVENPQGAPQSGRLGPVLRAEYGRSCSDCSPGDRGGRRRDPGNRPG